MSIGDPAGSQTRIGRIGLWAVHGITGCRVLKSEVARSSIRGVARASDVNERERERERESSQ